jgi:hypothetical protein
VFQLIPEDTYVVDLIDPTDEELTVLKRAAGKYIGACDDDAVDHVLQVYNWINGWYDDNDTKHLGKWEDKVKVGMPDKYKGPFDLVVFCGQYL